MKKLLFTAIITALGISGGVHASRHSLYKVDVSPYAFKIARKPGDLLTIVINENFTTKDDGNASMTKKYDNFKFTLEKFFFPYFKMNKGFDDTMGGGDTPGMSATAENKYTSNAKRNSTQDFQATIQVRILEVIDHNQFLVRGHRTVRLNGKDTKIFVSGVVRERDISLNNSVQSQNLADANIEIEGEVLVNDLSPGPIKKLLDLFF